MSKIVLGIIAAVTLAAPLSAQRVKPVVPVPPALAPEVAAALAELEPRYASEIALTQGWFRDRTVLYYDFGSVPMGAASGRVLWPIHGFDAAGNPVAIRGQHPIFSNIPGVAGYSGVYKLAYVVTADHAQPNQLRDIASIDDMVRRGRASIRETDVTYNLPIVPRGSRLARDSARTGMTGWFAGREVQFFDFGPTSVTPVPMWRFARGTDAGGQPQPLDQQSSIVDSIPVSGTYPDLWEIYFVQVDTAYTPNTLKSASAVRGANFMVNSPATMRNLPIVIIDGAPVQRTPSPVKEFADQRSPFPPAPTRAP
ncbi:MAG TPA: hypothetical protein VEB19_17995 [Gemmatimonadaceae bacterium]|nr:hypothetical protein [Gemmatimonadaceae bacterium]